MSLKIACPSCGGEVPFLSPASVSATCPWCHALLVRHDLDVEKIGSESLPPPDLSVVQLGSQGKYGGTAFAVVGKLAVGWQDGRWNEWYLYFEDGRDGWLAEAQGEWMLSFAYSPDNIPPQTEIALGRQFALHGGERFTVHDFREVSCLGCAGELPVMAARGRAGFSVDLAGSDEQFACIEYSEQQNRLYIGRHVDFDALHMTGLRELDGW